LDFAGGGADPRIVSEAATLELRRSSTGIVLKVRLTPKSARDEIVGIQTFGGETVLKARVRALAEQGSANAALERLVAGWLGVPPSSVSVTQGGKSRLKQVSVEGDADLLHRLIEARLAALTG
jgi:uncharacterized protein YggU (UPF0235/DUF167 family)